MKTNSEQSTRFFYDGVTTHFLHGTKHFTVRLLKLPANPNALPNTSNRLYNLCVSVIQSERK